MKKLLLLIVSLGLLVNTVNAASPTMVAKFSAVNQTASIPTTTIYTVPANGTAMYRISGYIEVQSDCTTGNTIQAFFDWTDDLGLQSGADGFGTGCSGTARQAGTVVAVRMVGSSTLSFHTVQAVGTYSIYLVVEKLE